MQSFNMKKILASLLLGFFGLSFALAADGDLENPEAVITMPESAKVGTGLFVDGTKSINHNPESPLSFAWEMGDGSYSNAKSFQYIYMHPGEYTVHLKVGQSVSEVGPTGYIDRYELSNETSQKIYIYEDIATLIYDKNVNEDFLTDLNADGRENNFFVKEIGTAAVLNSVAEEEILLALQENKDAIKESRMIFVMADPLVSFNALNDFYRLYGDDVDFSKKTIVVATDSNLSMISRIARGTLVTLQPERMLFVERPAVGEMVESRSNVEQYKELLTLSGYDFVELSPEENDLLLWNFMSYAIGDMVAHGVSQQYVLYLLIIPVIGAVISFMSQVIGMSTGGILAPVTCVFVFLFIGPAAGIATLFLTLLATIIVQKIFRRTRLLSTPKKALNLAFASLFFFGLLVLSANLHPEVALSVSILPLVMILLLSEKMVNMTSSKSVKQMVKFFVGLSIVSLIAWVLVQYRGFQVIILAYPELSLLFVLAIYLLGRWTGLRLTEYFRFRELIRDLQRKEEEE